MDLEFNSVKSFFKGKVNPKSTKKKLRESIFGHLPLCYTADSKTNHNLSFSKKHQFKSFIRNKDLLIDSNNSITDTNNTFNNRKLLNKINLSNKKPNNKKLKIKENKQKEKSTQNYSNISVNKSLHQINHNKKSKKELKHKKINFNFYNSINGNNISYTKTISNNNNLLKKTNSNNFTVNEKSKIILVKKNKKLLESKSNTKKEKRNYSTFNEPNNLNRFYNNNDYIKFNESLANKNTIENNKRKSNLLYKKKKIMNKQFLKLRLNFMDDSQNIPLDQDQYQYTNDYNNLEVCNILTKSQENLIGKNQPYFKIDKYTNKPNSRYYSLEKKEIKKDNFEKNIDIGIDTNHYNVNNININFNNIKVVNNISKKCPSVEKINKKKYIFNNDIIRNNEFSLKSDVDSFNSFQDNESYKNFRQKIKVSKTKSSLKIPKDIKNTATNVKIMKKKIIKGKSENILKITTRNRIMKIDSCTIEGKSFKQKYNQENFFMNEKFLNINEQFLIGICNGHGKHGKLISKYIINTLPKLIKDISDNEIINSYLEMNKQIMNENNKAFDCSLSGASCISLIVSLEKIISANLGDNKAILARYENGLYNYVNLNREHRPTMPDEKKRILEHNGKIGHLYEKSDSPKKVWLKNSDIPGLPISRSFGDSIAHNVGVISEPEVKNFYYNGNEKFIIMASHGFWDLIDGEESVEIIKEFYDNNMDAIGALNKLALEILNKCEIQHKTINDDITIIIIFFE